MSTVPFHYLDVRTFCYETEDESRVVDALASLVPSEIELAREETSGHHGDRIVILSTRLERADEMRYALEAIREADAFDQILAELADRVDDDCSFFVRFDKQRAFRGIIDVGTGIQFRGKIETYPATREKAISNLTSYVADDQ